MSLGRLSVSIDPKSAVFVYEKKKLKAIMRGALGEIAADARKRLSAKAGSGRIYYGSGGANADKPYKSGRHAASAAGQSPASVTGALRRSIKVQIYRSGQGGTVAAAFYDRFLEFGAQGGGGTRGATNAYKKVGGKRVRVGLTGSRVLQSRPTLTAALEARGSSLSKRIRDSIALDIAFKRKK